MDWAAPPHFADGGTVLVGLVLATEAERARRPDGRAHIDIEIHGHAPEDRVESALATADAVLQSIDALRTAAEDLAPSHWRADYLQRPAYPGLFVDALEFHETGLVRVLFDFGDLDILVLDLNPNGERSATVVN